MNAILRIEDVVMGALLFRNGYAWLILFPKVSDRRPPAAQMKFGSRLSGSARQMVEISTRLDRFVPGRSRTETSPRI